MDQTKGQLRLLQRIKFETKIDLFKQWCRDHGINIMEGEAWRTQAVALSYLKSGVGIADSKHCHGIARDLWIMDSNGNPIFSFKKDDQWDILYKKMADQWIIMGERSGYYFSNRFDPYHFELKEDYVK